MTDQQILTLFQARDERAVTALSEKYRNTCMRIAKRHLRSNEDAEECVNDVMMKLWQCIPPEEPRSLEAFIVTVTQRMAINMAQRSQALKRGGGTAAASLDEIAEAVPARETVEDVLHHKLLTAAVERFLDTLSDDAQTIFVERYRNDAAPREIAVKFGITGVHVRKSLMQTRRKLKRFLTEEGLL
ncbi:MAG: sigma-70 family RNA polymerase sigma factor [Oscillospiraceae bacterium]|nr:sigma-70 family RNA polymerase sigma factor [Oscillospiraceae bacterium]